MLSGKGLVDFVVTKLGTPYVYGAKGSDGIFTQTRLNTLSKQYPSTFTPSYIKKAEKFIGKVCTDCSGLISWYTGKIIGSSQMYSTASKRIPISQIKTMPIGTVLWKSGHVGVYIGMENGIPMCVEAKGINYGTIKSKVSDTKWKYGLQFSYITYSSSEDSINKTPIRKVIDVSKYNTINLSQTAKSGIKDIIIRVGYRAYSSGTITIDTKFMEHCNKAMAAGMNYGVYFYDQSINEAEATEQANWICDFVKPLTISYPIYIDSEYSNKNHNGRADNISKSQRTKNLIAFCEQIKKRGYVPGIYASDSWFKSMVDFEQLKDYEIWCARYSTKSPTVSRYDMWQYGSEVVSGASSPIDVNHLYKDYPAILSGKQEDTPEAPVNPSKPETPKMFWNAVTATALNIRNKPSNAGKILGSFKYDEKVNIYDYRAGWAKVSQNEEKWCSYKYIASVKGTVSNCSKLNCRKSPVSGAVIFVLENGDVVNILNQDLTGWYFIEKNGKVGYVSNKYIKL